MDKELLQIIDVFKKINRDMGHIIATSQTINEGNDAIVRFQCSFKRLSDTIYEIQNSSQNHPDIMSTLIKLNVTLIEIMNHIRSVLDIVCTVSKRYLHYVEMENSTKM